MNPEFSYCNNSNRIPGIIQTQSYREMSDPPKSNPAFSFGTSTTSGSSGAPKLFGELNSNNNTSLNMFGSSKPGTSGGLFGTTSGQPNNPSEIFGSNAGQSSSISNNFGSNSTAGTLNTGGFGFGDQKFNNQSSSTFGPNTGQGSTAGTFGSNAGQSSSTANGSGLFGSNPTQLTNNTLGSSNLFGQQPTSASSTFSGVPSTSASAQPLAPALESGTGQASLGLFGNTSATGGPLFSGNSKSNNANTTGSLFGSSNTKGGGNFTGFGAKPSDESSGGQSTTTGSGLFGSTTSNTSTNQASSGTPSVNKTNAPFSFGNASTTPAGPPPFGKPNQSTLPPTFNTSKPQEQKSLFGSLSTSGATARSSNVSQPGSTATKNQETPTASFNLFGSKQETAKPIPSSAPMETSNGLGNPPRSSKPSLFPTVPSATQSASSLFTGKNTGNSQEKPLQATTNPATKSQFPPFTMPGTSITQGGPAANSSASGSTQTSWGFPSAATSSAPSNTSTASATASSTLPKISLFQTSNAQPSTTSATATTSQPSTTTGPSASSSQPPANLKITEARSTSEPSGRTSITATGKDEERPFQPSLVGPRPSAQSRLRNKSVDEIITRWAADLTKYQKEFQKQAEKVATWDRMLVENSDKVQKLYGSTLEAEKATVEVERQLTSVEGDQTELEYWLDHYERQIDEMMQSGLSHGETLQGPDQERERT